jgi:mannosylglycerate hydrolase
VDICTTLENTAQDHRLRVHFPVPAAVDHAYTEAHFHVMRRPVPPFPEGLDTTGWVEQPVPTVPQRGWADVSDGQTGLMLANRGLPEVEFISGNDATIIALTLLRSVGWLSRGDLACRQGHAGPALDTPEAQCLGSHTFEYALIPHQGDWQGSHLEAEAFRTPLRAMATGTHAGSLPPAASIVEVDPPAFHLTAIKQFKNDLGPSLVVRGVNLSDHPVSVRLRPRRAFEQVTRANLNEDFREPLVFEPDGSVIVPAGPWEIVTIRWRDG